jgi:hypothetical protein
VTDYKRILRCVAEMPDVREQLSAALVYLFHRQYDLMTLHCAAAADLISVKHPELGDPIDLHPPRVRLGLRPGSTDAQGVTAELGAAVGAAAEATGAEHLSVARRGTAGSIPSSCPEAKRHNPRQKRGRYQAAQ